MSNPTSYSLFNLIKSTCSCSSSENSEEKDSSKEVVSNQRKSLTETFIQTIRDGISFLRPEKIDFLSVFLSYPNKVKSYLNELDEINASFSKNYAGLVNKINIETHELISALSAGPLSSESDESLLAAYKMASHLKTYHPSNKEIWSGLSNKTKKLFDKLTPFILPPDQKLDESLAFCSWRNESAPPFNGYFGDCKIVHLKCLKNSGNTNEVLFELPSNPGYHLHRKGPKKYISNPLNNLPERIGEIFDLITLEKKLKGYEEKASNSSGERSYNSVADNLIDQYRHQALTLKKEYTKKLLSVLPNIPIFLPALIGDQGEYIIYQQGKNKSLKDLTPSNTSLETYKQIANDIIQIFQAEAFYGINLLGSSSLEKVRDIDSLFFLKDNQVFLKDTTENIEFIEDPIERFDRIAFLLKLQSPDLYKQIISLSIQKSSPFIKFISIVNLSDHEILDIVNGKTSLENLWDSICFLSKKIIADIPKKGIPIPPKRPNSKCETKFEELINIQNHDQNKLNGLLIHYLLAVYFQQPGLSFHAILEKLFTGDPTVAEDQGKIFNDLTSLLKEESEKNPLLMRVIPFADNSQYSDNCSSIEEYFYLIFWQQFQNHLSLAITSEEPFLFEIQFLCFVYRNCADEQIRKDIYRHLIDCLHSSMLVLEKKRLASQLRNCLQK